MQIGWVGPVFETFLWHTSSSFIRNQFQHSWPFNQKFQALTSQQQQQQQQQQQLVENASMRLKVKELISWWIVQLLLQLDQTNNPIIADTSLMLHICIETNLNFDQKSDGNEPILMKIIKILSSAWVCVIRSVIWIQPCNLPEITFAEGQNLECFPGIESRRVWWNECDDPSY